WMIVDEIDRKRCACIKPADHRRPVAKKTLATMMYAVGYVVVCNMAERLAVDRWRGLYNHAVGACDMRQMPQQASEDKDGADDDTNPAASCRATSLVRRHWVKHLV